MLLLLLLMLLLLVPAWTESDAVDAATRNDQPFLHPILLAVFPSLNFKTLRKSVHTQIFTLRFIIDLVKESVRLWNCVDFSEKIRENCKLPPCGNPVPWWPPFPWSICNHVICPSDVTRLRQAPDNVSRGARYRRATQRHGGKTRCYAMPGILRPSRHPF